MSLASRAPVHHSFDSEKAGDREVQRTMLELLNQLDGFQPNTQVKVNKKMQLSCWADPGLRYRHPDLPPVRTMTRSCGWMHCFSVQDAASLIP